jgi:hypothetical protein
LTFVVRVDRLLRAQLAARELDGGGSRMTPRLAFMFALGAGARLEDDQGEVVVGVAGGRPRRRCPHDQLHLLRRQLAEVAVRLRGALLQHAEGPG